MRPGGRLWEAQRRPTGTRTWLTCPCSSSSSLAARQSARASSSTRVAALSAPQSTAFAQTLAMREVLALDADQSDPARRQPQFVGARQYTSATPRPVGDWAAGGQRRRR